MPQAWLRGRGDAGSTLFTAETVAEQFGVARNSYDAVQLPYRDVLQVRQACNLHAGVLGEKHARNATQACPAHCTHVRDDDSTNAGGEASPRGLRRWCVLHQGRAQVGPIHESCA